jgi:hypothetical protein
MLISFMLVREVYPCNGVYMLVYIEAAEKFFALVKAHAFIPTTFFVVSCLHFIQLC